MNSKTTKTISTAESCTGGLLASDLVSISGASKWFRSGIVSYQKDIKVKYLNVDQELADKTNCVHPEIARQMAKGVREMMNSDIGIATTGYAEKWTDSNGTIYEQICYYCIYQDNTVYQETVRPLGKMSRNEFRQYIVDAIKLQINK